MRNSDVFQGQVLGSHRRAVRDGGCRSGGRKTQGPSGGPRTGGRRLGKRTEEVRACAGVWLVEGGRDGAERLRGQEGWDPETDSSEGKEEGEEGSQHPSRWQSRTGDGGCRRVGLGGRL